MNYLIYSSHRKEVCTDTEIQSILKACEKNNPQRDITGVLLHSGRYFLQYLEGSESEILELYHQIKDDERHERVVLLSKGEIEDRHFPNWHMGYKDADTSDVHLQTTATPEEMEAFNQLLKGKSTTMDTTKALSILTKFYKMI